MEKKKRDEPEHFKTFDGEKYERVGPYNKTDATISAKGGRKLGLRCRVIQWKKKYYVYVSD